MVAEILRGEVAVESELEAGEDYGVGKRAFRIDVRKRVLGYGEYPDDIRMDDMVHVSAVRSQYPRARVVAIHAEKAPGFAGGPGGSHSRMSPITRLATSSRTGMS